jgi:hypothetical protein
MKTAIGVGVAERGTPAGINFTISNPPNPAGAEACRYSENRQFIFASSALFCGHGSI